MNFEADEGMTLLVCAVECSSLDTVKLLLDQGADVNHRTDEGMGITHIIYNLYITVVFLVLLNTTSEKRKDKKKVAGG